MKNKNLQSTSEPIKTLRKLQSLGFTTAILAGGAVRDNYTGKQINDYDLFLWDPYYSKELQPKDPHLKVNYESDCQKPFSQIIPNIIQVKSRDNGYSSDLTEGNITAIWEGQGSVDHKLYQIIWTKVNPIQYVNDCFDVGICKAYCDGKKIHYTPDFLRDLKDKTLTIVAKDMTQEQFTYSMDHHIDRIRWKYPTCKVKAAPHNQHLMEVYQKS